MVFYWPPYCTQLKLTFYEVQANEWARVQGMVQVKCEYPNAFITEIGKVTEKEMWYSNGLKVTQILLEIDLRRISTNKISNQNIMLSLLSCVRL